jgi:hypothetical protein
VVKPFITIDLIVDPPANVTLPEGDVGYPPVRGGAIAGVFNGSVVTNATNNVEKVNFSKSGDEYTVSIL